MTLLLLSNSRNPGGEYLAHAMDALAEFLGPRRTAWFVPFAAVTVDWDDYARMVQNALTPLGVQVSSAHTGAMPDETGVLLVGGGNTFQLLRECRRRALLEPMGRLARGGVPYAGWSAGSNLACPTIRTTNDMPIVEPGSLDALGLVGFQINPHYTNAMPPGHQGETREQRLMEFVTANPDVPVLGLPEGDWLSVRGDAVALCGPKDAVWIRSGAPTGLLPPGTLPPSFTVA